MPFGLWARRASRLLHPAIELTSLKVIMDGGEFEPFCYHFNNFNSELPLSNWMEVDSNHRSNLQQIYSLSPLATRESIQKYRIFNCTILYWFLNTKPMIGLEPITCWLQISCSANWATSARNHWLQQMNYIHQMDGEGFEPSKASPADLQSVPFGHSGIHPYGTYRARTYDPLLVRQMLSQLS